MHTLWTTVDNSKNVQLNMAISTTFTSSV